MDDEALIKAIGAIRDLTPDVKANIWNMATLTEKVANIEGNTTKLFDMLLGMQKNEQQARRDRLKLWLGFALAALTTLGNLVYGYLTYKK